MASANNPLLFIISEPVGSPVANEVAYRLADHNVRTWIGSLAPGGELNEAAMDAMRASAAALLIFDEAAVQSRHVDRHLLVARQAGKPLIPLRIQATDEGLLRQELLDAQWIDGTDREAAIQEISRRAFDYDRAQREQVRDSAEAAALAAAGAGAAAAHLTEPVLSDDIRTDRHEHAAPRPAPVVAHEVTVARSGRSRFLSPTMLIVLVALVLIVGAIAFTSMSMREGAEPAEREVADRPVPTTYADRDVAGAAVPEPAPALPAIVADSGAPPGGGVIEPAPMPTEGALLAPEAAPRPPRQMEQADDPEERTPLREPVADGGSGAASTVRSFYSALSRGNGAAAAQLVVPDKRQSGPLSGPALTRYYSSFRRPLRLRAVTPVDANNVRVAYDYVLADGRLCQGEATVRVAGNLVSGINTRGPC